MVMLLNHYIVLHLEHILRSDIFYSRHKNTHRKVEYFHAEGDNQFLFLFKATFQLDLKLIGAYKVLLVRLEILIFFL